MTDPSALAVARKVAGHTQASLAAAVGCSKGYVGHLEKGVRGAGDGAGGGVTLVLAEAIAKAIGRDLNELFLVWSPTDSG